MHSQRKSTTSRRSSIASALLLVTLALTACHEPISPREPSIEARPGGAQLVPGPGGDGPRATAWSTTSSLPESWAAQARVVPNTSLPANAASASMVATSPYVIWQNTQTGERVFWEMNGTSYTGSQVSFGVNTNWSIAASADLSGDGQADLVWQNSATGERVIWQMNGTTYTGTQVSFNVGTTWDIAAAADFSGDGKADLVWQNTVTGERVIWQMNNMVYTGTQTSFGVNTNWTIAAAADFTSDNKPDLVWQNTSTGERVIWQMNNMVYSGTQTSFGVNTTWDIAAAADYTGDSAPDLVWQNLVTGERVIWRMTGPTYSGTQFALGGVSTPWKIVGALALPIGPVINTITPATLTPGTTATITGTGFSATLANNTVSIGGRAATVTSASTTELQATVPCLVSGTAAVFAVSNTRQSASVNKQVSTPQLTLTLGAPLFATNPAALGCNEIPATGVTTRYLISVYSASSSNTTNTAFSIVGDVAGTSPADVLESPDPDVIAPMGNLLPRGTTHLDVLEKNREAADRLRARFPNESRKRRALAGTAVVPPPVTRTFKVSNLNSGNICTSSFSVNATRVYYNGKVAIYQDDATPSGFLVANNATMQDYYNKIGDQFNADMEPIVRTNFSDPLLRDATTDNNGVVVALFTPVINTNFPSIAGFVVSCDQYPNDPTTNSASNYGEYFYAYQPTVAGAGYGGNTADNWFRTIRSTFIHETKHVAAQAYRVQNAFSFEVSWLEEGLARHSEELWARQALDAIPFQSNQGYGSAASPKAFYCDLRPSAAGCNANPRRPAYAMANHLGTLTTHLFSKNARLLSPFGPTASDDGFYFYAVSWSLIRYAADRYGASDAAFLSALTQTSSTGASNLAARTGVAIDELLGEWNLALALDDRPGVPPGNLVFKTWNLRDIYNGFFTDGVFSSVAYPLVPTPVSFGAFPSIAYTTLRGGGALWYELSGTQTAGQAIGFTGPGGGAIPANLRLMAIRIQ